MKTLTKLMWFTAFSIMVSLEACTSDPKNMAITDDPNRKVGQPETIVNKIFITIPSPIEMASLLKRAGAKYDQSLLNPLENRMNYVSDKSMALNLGVYSADLSFVSIYDQSQSSISYTAACKKLAEDLNIIDAIPKSTIDRMEENLMNKDSLVRIISETFMNSNSYLTENERESTAAMILAGGWIEGLYLATRLSQTSASNEEIISRVIDQRLSLDNLMELLKKYDNEESVRLLHEDLNELVKVFAKVTVNSSPIVVVTDPSTNTSIIKSSSAASMSPAVFEELCERVAVFRNKITA